MIRTTNRLVKTLIEIVDKSFLLISSTVRSRNVFVRLHSVFPKYIFHGKKRVAKRRKPSLAKEERETVFHGETEVRGWTGKAP